MDRGGIWKSNVEISPNCPRCGSSNTKFCYYNNYSLTQPRYFCKGCRRYWTRGGSLRNVPVGGGCRKNRRPNKLSLVKPTAAAGAGGGSVTSNNQDGSTDSKNISSGFHIDLALVYANFLNLQPQHQDSKIDESTVTELPSVNIGPELLRVDGDQQLSDVSNQLLPYFSELDSIHHPNTHHQHKIHHQQYFGLPPFPGEEVGSHEHEESLWSNLGLAQALQASSCSSAGQLLGLQQEAPEPNLLVSGGDHSWSPFDLSTFDSFSRP